MTNKFDSDSKSSSISKLFDEIFSQISYIETIDESLNERRSIKYKNFNQSILTYGEVNFDSIKKIFEMINLNFGENSLDENKSFVDLGSGIGKAVIAAALLGKFEKCDGVEILENLCVISTACKEMYEYHLMRNNYKTLSNVNFFNKNLKEFDFSEYDVVFTNSTCWNEDILNNISKKTDRMKINSFLINTDQQLKLDGKKWMKIKPFNVKMSWGIAKTFVNRRIL